MPRTDGALLAGVCATIARTFGWNVWVLRALLVAFLLIKTLWAIGAYAIMALALHLGDHFNGRKDDGEELSSPELSERNRRIADLEKRFRDLENR